MKEFKDVKGYEDLFKVSKDGEVLSKRTNRILKLQISPSGYLVFSTKIGGRQGITKLFRVHRVVADTFIDNPENKPFVNHIDGNKLNNNVTNLEWVTAKENTRHAVEIGLINNQKQYDHYRCKFSREQRDNIRTSYIPRDKEYGARALAKKYGIAHSTISKIVRSDW